MLYLQLPARASVWLAGTLPASCSMRGVTDLDPILRLLTPARLHPLSLLLLSQRASVCIKITFFYWIQYFNSDAVRLFEWGSAENGGGEGGSAGAGLAGIYTYILFHGCLNFKITSNGGIAHRHVAQQQRQRQQKQQPEERQGVRQRHQVEKEEEEGAEWVQV